MENFDSYYPLLFTIARRMLGSTSDVEDLVQESYIRYATSTVSEIGSLKAYLVTIITRLCLDYLKSARVQREQSFEFSPPGSTDYEDAEEIALNTIERDETLSIALSLLLECLTSDERAVFLLHEVFTYSYEEISSMTGKSSTSCRQLLHRAKVRLHERRPRFVVSCETHKRLEEHFLVAARHGDIQRLLDTLI